MSTKTALVLSSGFIAGAIAAVLTPLAVPAASAQTTARWEVFCAETNGRNSAATARAVMAAGNRLGADGWELVSAPGSLPHTDGIACFKRPLR